MMQIKDGDVFKWKYKDDAGYRAKHSGSGTAYWCLDQQCFATKRSGVLHLIDTYWTDYGAEYLGHGTSYVCPDNVDLEFVCNLKDIEFIEKWEVEDYDAVYNLSRQKDCYKKYAIDKGDQPSKAAILKKITAERDQLVSDVDHNQWRIKMLNAQIEEMQE